MTFYTRHQLLIVLLLAAAAGGGLAVDHWRRARPDVAERLERLDRAAPGPAPRSAPPPRSPSVPRRGRSTAPERSGAPVDLNRATASELAGLPGIGPALAARIVAARPFAEVEELRRVRGLRRATLERLRPHVTAGEVARTAR